ncbi:CapA family protein [uncultured Duncaniella sp.]|uniref:CapA family protein n=1 Tax=uncultured Duncaniella sp. TaxID=2768039 RepID=UPI0025DD6E3A|nr:CapA family protein [uncultured Duncaniella sp.]
MIAVFLSLLSMLIPQDSAEIVFAGDAMQHQRQIDAALQPDGSLDYSPYFSSLSPYISSADFAVVNLETPLGGAPYSGYPMFCAHDNYVDALTEAGFNLLLTANNHILDRRDKGVIRTINTLEGKGVPYIGVYRNIAHRDSLLPMIHDINGFKVAFLNYTYGTNGITKRTDIEIDYIDRARIASDISNARNKGAEIIAACIHWGEEYKLLPNASQKSLAKFLADAGVELIIGGHPHVIQPMKLKIHQPTGRPCFTVYSLGNFISSMRTTDTRGGAMARVKLARDIFGRAYVCSASYRLVFTQPALEKGDNFRLLPAESRKLHKSMEHFRKGFIRNAVNIFNRHNINVPRDTTSIVSSRPVVPNGL